ncbi:MAG: hypothetical protein ACTH7O_11820 [Microbacterium gubbeenense]|uniref:hypothetical protein n=1 Tax=Microbacterium gubbeenense TaxID=159896 RepID=UPI003F9B0FCA
MRSYRRLAWRRDRELSGFLRDVARHRSHVNVFNPSFVHTRDALVVAYRAIPEGETGIRAYVAVREHPAAAADVTDLSAWGAARGIDRVADPKVLLDGDAVYVTFNTGFVPADQFNDIHLMRVHPGIGEPQRVVADFDRQSVEKNWAFRAHGAALSAVYRLHPYAEVVRTGGDLGASGDLTFSLRVPARADSDKGADLSIGTQLIADGGAHRLIAHEKVYVEGKRSYYGRAVTIEGVGTDDVAVRVAPRRLIHTLRDAEPREGVHNPNLLSATYFSGLERRGSGVVLGYGINDIASGIARVRGTSLWP